MVRYLFEVSPEAPEIREQQLLEKISAIKQLPEQTLIQQQTLTRLEMQLDRVQKSRAFVDELYDEQQKLRAKEQELEALITLLSQKPTPH